MNLLKSDHHLIYGSSMNISDNRSRLMNQQTKRRGDHASVIASNRSNLIKMNSEKISKFKINYLKMNQIYEQDNTSREFSFLDMIFLLSNLIKLTITKIQVLVATKQQPKYDSATQRQNSTGDDRGNLIKFRTREIKIISVNFRWF